MKKLLLLLLLIPALATAQVNGIIQKTNATGIIRGSFGTIGIDTLANVKGSLTNTYMLRYNSTTKGFEQRSPVQVLGDIGAASSSSPTFTGTVTGVASTWSGLMSVSVADATGLNVTNNSATLPSTISRNNGVGPIHSFFNTTGGVSFINNSGLLQTSAGTSAQFLTAAGTIENSTGTGSVVRATSPTLVTPALGTPSALVGTNITGTASGLTAGTVTTNANLTGPITSVGNATSVAAQTGTGSTFVMNTSPTLVTPNIGAATGTSINLTGTGVVQSGLTVGASTYQNYAALYLGGSTTSTANQYAIITDAAMNGTNNYGLFSNAKLRASATATNAYGAYITNAEKGAGATLSNNYGLYIENQTSGSTLNYSIYSAGGLNYFGGTVTLGATPTTSAGTYDILTRNTSTGVVEKVASGGLINSTAQTFSGSKTWGDGFSTFSGSVRNINQTITATSYTAGIYDYTIRANATGAAITIILPSAASANSYNSTLFTGIIYIIKKSDSSVNTVTIDANGAETIDGATTKVISTQYSGYAIQSNGTSWDIIGTF